MHLGRCSLLWIAAERVTARPIDTVSTSVLHRAVPTRGSQRPFNVAYYARNRRQEIERVRARQAATLEFLRELRRVLCTDCGGTFEPYQMDFDHREPVEKSFNVTAGRAMLMSRERLMEEIAKCDIVCANCHALRTYAYQSARAVTRRALGLVRTTRRAKSQFLRSRVRRDLLLNLSDKPCCDCRAKLPPYVMQFDHRDPASKRFNVAQSWCRSELSILEEAAKCDVVCPNCHRERTHRQRLTSVVQRHRRDAESLDVTSSVPERRSAVQLRLIEEAAVRYAA